MTPKKGIRNLKHSSMGWPNGFMRRKRHKRELLVKCVGLCILCFLWRSRIA